MSGQQIGTVVGGVIGAYFGMPQLGMAVGGLIGGAIDPTKVNGPHIGDGQQQQATDGAVISWVLGTAWVAGTIVQVGPRREVKIQDSGKGGPEVSHYEARQTFAILVCESCSLRNSVMSDVLAIEQDGKIVYDARGGAGLPDSLKWKTNVDFLFGDEDQLPHPSLEAITGVGNTPAYRGSLVVVFSDFNITQAGDRIPSFRFLVKSSFEVPTRSAWRMKQVTVPYGHGPPSDYYSDGYDDSAWEVGEAPFGRQTAGEPDFGAAANAFNSEFLDKITTDASWYITGTSATGTNTHLLLRRDFYLPRIPPSGLDIYTVNSKGFSIWLNGNPNYYYGSSAAETSVLLEGPVLRNDPSYYKVGKNTLVVDLQGLAEWHSFNSYFDMMLKWHGASVDLSFSDIVSRICERGGLSTAQIDVNALATTSIIGYPIAKQCTGVDALLPLLQAYFAYGSSYDSKLHFNFYGADAIITVDPLDLLAADDGNDDAVTKNLRNNATEFPLRMLGSYYDPAQNYMPVQVSDTRRSSTVVASGDRQFDIPLSMYADTAQQAINKAMKVAYATLEGTLSFQVPFAGISQTYLSLCAGEPFIFYGKRWVIDKLTIGQGSLKISGRYDRQDAYTSNVQAIKGNDPLPNQSRYSGPTDLIVLNLPSLRPQDTYGVYLVAASADGRVSWRGCSVQVSLDGQQSWQAAVDILTSSVFGQLSTDEETISSEEFLIVGVNGDLESVTESQLDAQANAFALVRDDTHTEIGQFELAIENSSEDYALSGLRRGLLGTPQLTGIAGDVFAMLANAYFFPIDISFKGKTLYFRAIGFGEVADSAEIIAFTYNPDTTVIHDGGLVTGP